MSLAFIIHVILYALIGLYISIFFLMLLILNRDVRTIYGNIIVKSIIIISIALTWYYIPLLWLTPHSCFNEYMLWRQWIGRGSITHRAKQQNEPAEVNRMTD